MRLAADQAALVDRTLTTIIEAQIPAYRRVRNEFLDDARSSIQENTRIWYRCLLRGRTPDTGDLLKIATSARRRVHQDVPLASLLHAYRIAISVFWQTILDAATEEPAIQPEVLFQLSRYAFLHSDLISQTVSQAYMDELGNKARWRERVKQELLEIVHRDPVDEPEFQARISRLGIDPSSSYCALAVRLKQSPDQFDPPNPHYGLLPQRAATLLGVGADDIVDAVRHGHLILWIPVPGRAVADSKKEKIARIAEGVFTPDTSIERIGAGLPGRLAQGWRRSAEQALRALEIGPALDPGSRCHFYEDVVVYDVAARTPAVEDFLDRIVERLSLEPSLAQAAEAYFRHGRHIKAAAGALGIHPNTITYRIRRAADLLGGRLDDPTWCLAFELAIRLRTLRSSKTESGGEPEQRTKRKSISER